MMGKEMIGSLCVAAIVLAVASADASTASYVSPWTYTCEGVGDTALCVKSEAASGPANSLNHCKLTCGPYSALWPRPSIEPTLGKEVSGFTTAQITHTFTVPATVDALITEAFGIFMNNLDHYHPDYNWLEETAPWGTPTDASIASHVVDISITVTGEDTVLLLATDESYDLIITQAGDVTTAAISAQTFFGARHGLETLSQLMNYMEENDCLQILNSASILADAPVFPYRGLIVDTARNYASVKEIERTICAMAGTKLNSFHWHITDTHSFPLVIDSQPQMHTYGAYSDRHLYTAENVRHLVQYGLVRGVRVIPEIDAPAHIGNGWQWGPNENLGDLAVCVNLEPWKSYCVEPPCGQLNLANENMYGVLDTIYKEVVENFGYQEMFHFGGDEVNSNCWASNPGIVEWMQKRAGREVLTESDYVAEWANFQNRAYDLVTKNNKDVPATAIIWSSHLTSGGNAELYLDNTKYVIQIWAEKGDWSIQSLLGAGFRVIFSNSDSWYLDCGFSAWIGEGNNWCSPYKGWQKVYDNNPYKIASMPEYYPLVMGGEAALWSEQTDGASMDAKLWPRGAALGERLWANPDTNWEPAEYRIVHHRQRMVQRGIAAERLQPEWCHQNEGLCYL